jgi:serine/threonine protein kinase
LTSRKSRTSSHANCCGHQRSYRRRPTAPPFNRFTSLQWLAPARSGRRSAEHGRHHLFVGRDRVSRADLLIKLTSKPGLLYQRDLSNEIATLTAINRSLPDSRSFPIVDEHGQLRDGRVYLVMSLFAELPLAMVIGPERVAARLVAHLRTSIAIANVLSELHQLSIVHVDLNPMNILYRVEKGKPVIRIVDFESSYDATRYADGDFYSPPTTSGFCAPEVQAQAPDARADLFSLGAVLYTLLAGYDWTWRGEVGASIKDDADLDEELKELLLRATASRPEERYASADAFRDAIVLYLERIWPGRA